VSGGFDVALDMVGGNALVALIRSAAWDARILVMGFAAGVSTITANRLLLSNCSLIGVNYAAGQDPDLTATAKIHADLFGWISQGKLKPRVPT
jgi:NADPH2:quinone reductase